jgi:RNA-directed DNA polymerase
MTTSPINLQDLTKRIYAKAKAEQRHRFWGLYVHVCKPATLLAAYELARKNDGAPGLDGATFDSIEAGGVESFLATIGRELIDGTYQPAPNRKKEIPKGNGKTRVLGIPNIRDRVVQAALKIIIEPIFEADFSDVSFGYRPGRTQHDALDRVKHGINREHTRVIDVDLSGYFDNVKHHILLKKLAQRICDPRVLRLLKLILKANGSLGVPQGGVISPLLSNVYLHDVDKVMEKAIEVTSDGPYPNMTFARYADDMVALVSTHPKFERTEWLLAAVTKRLEEEFAKLDVKMNREKTKTVELKKGESFSFLGFDFFIGPGRKDGPPGRKKDWIALQTPRTKKRSEVLGEVREILQTLGTRAPLRTVITRINATVSGWVNYFRYGNSAKTFGYVRYHVEKGLRRLLMRRLAKRGFGWKRWDDAYLYGALGLFDAYLVRRYTARPLRSRYAT